VPPSRRSGREGLPGLEWRTPPTDNNILGDGARSTRPRLVEAIFAETPERAAQRGADHQVDATERERAAYRFRRRIGASVPGVYARVVLVPHHRAQGPRSA